MGSKKFNYDNLAENLPDAFAKDENSNNYKLLNLHKFGTDQMRMVLAQISESMTIGGADGHALDDVHGGRVNLARGSWNDDAYKIRLRAKTMQNITDGSFPKMVEALAYILQIDPSEIKIYECDDANAVIIADISLLALDNAGIPFKDIVPMVERLLPVNVHVREYGFSGTLEFTGALDYDGYGAGHDEAHDYDEDRGFGSMNSDVGGYFGTFDRIEV